MTHPAIVIFMQKLNELACLQFQFIFHGRSKVELDTVHIADWRGNGGSGLWCH